MEINSLCFPIYTDCIIIVRLVKTMKKWIRRYLVVVLGIAAAFVVLVWIVSTVYYYASGEAEFARKFDKVMVGELKSKVIALLGEPNDEGKEFRLGQKEEFEAAYRKTEKSKSSYFLFWYRGIDTLYTIGFDAQDKVTITESGGT
jgi:hypothetical protein